jgi:hypothetical protein
VEAPEIDAEVPLLAGTTAPYVTDPHGWAVSTTGYTTMARKGRLSISFDKWANIHDSESYEEDENVYGVPTSAAEARALAELYQEAEDIVAALKSGVYVPPPPDGFVYSDNRTRKVGTGEFALDTWLPNMESMMNTNSYFGSLFSTPPLAHRMRNLVNRIHGRPEVEYEWPKRSFTIKLAHYD